MGEKTVTFQYKGTDANQEATKVTAPYELAKALGYTGADPNKKKAPAKAAAKSTTKAEAKS